VHNQKREMLMAVRLRHLKKKVAEVHEERASNKRLQIKKKQLRTA
jgi:hypothetical protein